MKNPSFDFADSLTLRLAVYEHVFITLVGCGGTGSHIASGLATLALALAERNIPTTLFFIDPDGVEPKNVGRQLFSPAEVGQPKAHILANRLQSAFGLMAGVSVRWIDALDTFQHRDRGALNIVIGAVDNPAARAIIASAVKKAEGRLWWLDAGNENHSGQIALGNIADPDDLNNAVSLGLVDRLPAPHLVYPDLVATPKVKKPKRAANCAEAVATGEQGLMVNRMVAAWALSLLNDFLLGQLRYFALDFDLMWGGTHVHALDEKTLTQFQKATR